MAINRSRIRDSLRAFDFGSLFIEELGWDRHRVQPLVITVDEVMYQLDAVAEKRGMVVFICASPGEKGLLPDHAIRRRIENQVRRIAHEHLIVYIDNNRTMQVWQWVRREPGRPAACREHTYRLGQSGDALLQKLEVISFGLDEEESLSITVVASRARHAFDVERITKRFFDRFKSEHRTFLAFISGIQAKGDREWYASLMLNRLMFIYFIQKKGFLDNDTDYLRQRLKMMRKRKGKDQFLSFYRHFALRLFHEGFATQARDSELDSLLGKVPYINGGLFDVHKLEVDNPSIEIPDEAFETIFDFFDAYQWHLDERPLRADNEINPDVLGYIFEKYVNQRQMGAYYTKEDITEYIAKNTVLPIILSRAREQCEIAFAQGSVVWQMLKVDPDRYIYDIERRGMDHPLPNDIEIGIADLAARSIWNRPAGPDFGLPTETWREVVDRRERVRALRARLASGQIESFEQFATLNLNVRQFCQDAIEDSEGPELVRAIYGAITSISILDPACGSGAFLFAALNVLEPLYEACLDRMRVFVDEAAAATSHNEAHFADFRALLDQVDDHANRRYFILKSIILDNLYGVDIMDEAVEICKLRLFLKLVAQVEKGDAIEPLPDIDFNIRPGNSLVGFVNYAAVQRVVLGAKQVRLDLGDDLQAIDGSAARAEDAFNSFRRIQSDRKVTSDRLASAKADLLEKLQELRLELDRYLSSEYGVSLVGRSSMDTWRDTYKPFHWWVEFYGIISSGGFDVVIGNPPYLELREIPYSPIDLSSTTTGAVHAMFVERSLQLLSDHGAVSMILPLSLVSTQRMAAIQEMLEGGRSVWYSNFSWRPGRLFDAVNRALTIFVAVPSRLLECTYSTGYQKWNSESRDTLFPTMSFVQVPRGTGRSWVPKLGFPIEQEILDRCSSVASTMGKHVRNTENRVYYRTTGGLYWKVFTDFPPAFCVNGEQGHSTRETTFSLDRSQDARSVIAILSSNLFWWWYTISSNCRDLNPFDIQNFPVPEGALHDNALVDLGKAYLEDLQKNSTMLVRNQRQTGRTQTQSFKIQRSMCL